jgi:hypothetical protein
MAPKLSRFGAETRLLMKTTLMHYTAVFALLIAFNASADPQITSWFTNYSGKYARIYTSDANKLSGTSVTTWSTGTTSQSSPAYNGVQEVYSSTSWIYVRSTGLGSHVMGPWYLNTAHTQAFPQYPINTKILYRIPRTPAIPTTKSKNNGGAIGYFVDGVAMFNSWDAFYWNAATSSESGGGNGGYWNRDAYVNEGPSFDPANAHQPQDGTYHYHANPNALRYLLGDHVDFNSSTKAYTESTTTPTTHSPILGWVADGYPIYGPYGYSSASNSASGIRRMISGYVLRNGQSNTANLTVTGRTTIPQWAVRLFSVSASQSGPNVSTSYPLGRYMEDNDYLGDLGYTKGVDFDLDEYNGRWCVTPEFPNGTYAYFVSISTNGTPTFPYNIGRGYYGNPTGGKVTSISETVTTNYLGGPNSALTLNAPTITHANDNVALVWSSVDGGTYKVESSPDQSSWTTKVSSISSQGLSTQTNYTGTTGTAYARVTRTALASFDTAGLAATVSQTATQSYAISDTTPATVSAQPQSATVIAESAVTFSVTAAGATPITYQWQKNGAPLNDAGGISGSTTATLSFSATAVSDAGSYSVAVTNAYGGATSSSAILTVVTTPTVSVSPTSQTINTGTSTTIVANATGTGPLSYQWRKNGGALANGGAISGSSTSALSITSAALTDAATYSVVVSNAYGTATSVSSVVAVTAPPSVTISPSTQMITAGNSATISATASGAGTLGYQWSKNGSPLANATSILSITDALIDDSATYSVVVTNAFGSAIASSVLQVNADTTSPNIVITSPSANAIVTSSAVTATGSCTDETRIKQVLVRINGGDAQAATLTFGNSLTAATWSVPLTATPGTNIIEACAVDFSSNTSSWASATIFYKATATLAISTTGIGTVLNPSGTSLIIGSNYTVSAKAGTGYLFSNWVDSVTGTTTSSSNYTFTMQSNLTLTANFVANRFGSVAGTYFGLFSDATSGVTQNSAGFFKVAAEARAMFPAAASQR